MKCIYCKRDELINTASVNIDMNTFWQNVDFYDCLRCGQRFNNWVSNDVIVYILDTTNFSTILL